MRENEFNFVISNGHNRAGDAELFFPGEEVTPLYIPVTMIDLLVLAKVFPSKGKARSEWPNLSKKLGLSSFEIPQGWSDFEGLGKLKARITVLNPKPQEW